MARASWLKVNKTSGSGDVTISLSADQNTGRNERQTTLSVKGVGVATKTYTVKQSGAGVTLTSQDTLSANKDTRIITVVGTSNAESLVFAPLTISKSGSNLVFTKGYEWFPSVQGDPSDYAIQGYFIDDNEDVHTTYQGESGGTAVFSELSVNNQVQGAEFVDGDPGATAVYNWKLKVTIGGDNTGSIARTFAFRVIADNDKTADVMIVQSAGTAFLRVLVNGAEISNGATLFTLGANGSAKTMEIDSNVSWTIE